MKWWLWILIVLTLGFAWFFVASLPSLSRYRKIKNM